MAKRPITTVVVFSLMLALAGCEGPPGPQGQQGPQGPQGPKGDPGTKLSIIKKDCPADPDAAAPNIYCSKSCPENQTIVSAYFVRGNDVYYNSFEVIHIRNETARVLIPKNDSDFQLVIVCAPQ